MYRAATINARIFSPGLPFPSYAAYLPRRIGDPLQQPEALKKRRDWQPYYFTPFDDEIAGPQHT